MFLYKLLFQIKNHCDIVNTSVDIEHSYMDFFIVLMKNWTYNTCLVRLFDDYVNVLMLTSS